MFARGIWLKLKKQKLDIDQDVPPKVVSRYYPRSQWKHFEFKTNDRNIKVYKDGKEIEFVAYIEIDTEGIRIERYVDSRKYEVCSLVTSTHNNEESAGLFVLGVGAYNSQSKKDTNYYFYKKEKQGGWKLTKVDADDVVIFEDEDKKPYFVEVNRNNKDYDELHLPKNTIKKDINKIDIAELVK